MFCVYIILSLEIKDKKCQKQLSFDNFYTITDKICLSKQAVKILKITAMLIRNAERGN